MDTFDIREALDSAVEIAGPDLGAVRIDSGNLGHTAREVRAQLDALGATDTRITATSDLDEYRVFDLRDYPLDGYGIGTRLVTGGDHPAQGFVFKLVERENSSGTMEAVAKKSAQKATIAGSKRAYRVCDANGAARAELVLADDSGEQPSASLNARLVENGEVLDSRSQWERIEKARRVHERALEELSLADSHIRTGQDGDVLLPVVHSLQELEELSH